MKKKKVMSVVLAAIMTVGLLSGCGTSKESDSKEGEQVTLNYWTWFPSTDQIEETVKAFEKENPDIKINMTVMESKAFQEKVPLALSTEEDIDVIGVQPSAFAEEVQDYLADLDELMPEAARRGLERPVFRKMSGAGKSFDKWGYKNACADKFRLHDWIL